jgi:MFS family permease
MIGRKPVVLSGIVLGAIFIYPAYKLLKILGDVYIQSNANGALLGIWLILTILSLSLGLVVGPQTAILAELFPAKNRNSAATLPHNLAAGWIGGMLPLTVTWLNQQWGDDLAGLWYPAIFLAVGAVIALIYLPETKDQSLLD